MREDNFPKFIRWLMEAEGGYVNDKYDKGGETKYGISKRSYPNLDIPNLTKQQATDIYKTDYWDRSGANKEHFALSMVLADTAVLHGVSKARQWHKITGNWRVYLEIRWNDYNRIVANDPTQKRFLDGWRNRVNNLKKFIEEELANGPA